MSPERRVPRDEVRAQASLMINVLQSLLPGRLDDLADNPCAVLAGWDEVAYREVAAAAAGSRCSVAGAYYGLEEPPVLVVARANSQGRRAFTALHELGHHLQQSDYDLAEVVDKWGDDGGRFEDAACDAFAAAILVPDDATAGFRVRGPSADDVLDLHRRSSASRAAICVRAAETLRSPGHVVFLDQAGVVEFASAHGLPPLARGSDQTRVSVIEAALDRSTRRAQGQARFRYRDGIEGAELYVQTADMGGYLVAVAVTERPPWQQGFTLPLADTGPRLPSYVCWRPDCGAEFRSATARCGRCDTPPCTECERCNCERAVHERLCPSCFLVHPSTYFSGDRCRDCG